MVSGGWEGSADIYASGATIDTVENFCYLGSYISYLYIAPCIEIWRGIRPPFLTACSTPGAGHNVDRQIVGPGRHIYMWNIYSWNQICGLSSDVSTTKFGTQHRHALV